MKREEIPTPHPHHQRASARIAAALGTLPYPIERDEAIRRIGDWRIPYAREADVPLGQVLAALPTDRFRDVAQATNAVDEHWGRIQDTLRGAAVTEQDRLASPVRQPHE